MAGPAGSCFSDLWPPAPAPSGDCAAALPPSPSESDDEDEKKVVFWGLARHFEDRNLLMANACDNRDVQGYQLQYDASIRTHVIVKPKCSETTDDEDILYL